MNPRFGPFGVLFRALQVGDVEYCPVHPNGVSGIIERDFSLFVDNADVAPRQDDLVNDGIIRFASQRGVHGLGHARAVFRCHKPEKSLIGRLHIAGSKAE